MNKSQTTREKLCETAIEIAAREGLAAMTLDNVARHAGVSKGGVTYHFPSKDKLLAAVVEHFGERLERLVLERVANDPHPRHRWARAMLDCTFDEPAAESSTGAKTSRPTAASQAQSANPPSPGAAAAGASRLGVRPADWPDQMLEPLIIERFFLAVLAAATTQPGVIAPLRAVGHRVRERLLADPRDGFDQLLLWLALDGLLLWQFAGLIDRSDPLFAQVGRELRARVDSGFSQGLLPSTTSDNNSPRRRPTRPNLGETAPPLAPVAASTDPRARATEGAESPVAGRRTKRQSRSVHPAHPDPPAAPSRPARRRNRSS